MTTKKPLRYQFTFNGKRYSVTGKTQRELLNRVQKKKKQLEEHERIVRNISVNQWLVEWLETYKRGKVKDETFSTYVTILKAVDLSMPLKDVRPIHLQKIINDNAHRSHSYLHKLHNLMNQAFDSAFRNNLCGSNPASALSVPYGSEKERRAITERERDIIFETCKTSRARVYVLLMLLCGLRPSETSIVQGKDIDVDKMSIHVIGTKSKAADRYVPLPFILLKDLSTLKANDYAVTDINGKQTTKTSRRSLWKSFRHDMEAVSGEPVAEDFTAYCLRHTYATDLQAAEVPINVARDLLGHENISITSKVYTHRSEEAFTSAADKINAYQAKKQIRLAE